MLCNTILVKPPCNCFHLVLTCCSAVAPVAVFKVVVLCSALPIEIAIVVELFAIVTAIPIDTAVKPPRAVHCKGRTFFH